MFWHLAVSTSISCTRRPAGLGGSLKKDFSEAGSKGQRLLTSGAPGGVAPFHHRPPLRIPQ